MTAGSCPGISLDVALATARGTLASVAEEARQGGYYSGARTSLINAHADLRAALDMLVKAVGRDGGEAAPVENPDMSETRGRNLRIKTESPHADERAAP